jgi:hypothetical protein
VKLRVRVVVMGAIVVVLGTGLSGCTSATPSSGDPAESGSSPSAVAEPTSTCPPKAEKATVSQLVPGTFGSGYTVDVAQIGSASDTPVEDIVNVLGDSCVVKFEVTGRTEVVRGTIAFMPASRKSALVTALTSAGYVAYQTPNTYTLGGANEYPTVNIEKSGFFAEEYGMTNFTPFFPKPVIIVTTAAESQ